MGKKQCVEYNWMEQVYGEGNVYGCAKVGMCAKKICKYWTQIDSQSKTLASNEVIYQSKFY